ncbi:DUF4097 family beta strand repeat-containing protein [Streptomyces sp. HUAS MG47]|uniref:DUF4097 family beta strand repeat-containing protein n=1 Tax=Streptomyces solicamelliae TaxID=3231716 RepID=UPI0038780C56
MPSYDTPDPITAVLEFDAGTARVLAGKRTTTVVEVLPRDAGEEADVKAVQQTKVTYADGTLTLKGPRKRSLFGRTGSIDVTVELPAGSSVRGTFPMADVLCSGPLGDCRIKTSMGDIRLGEADAVDLRTSHGDVSVEHASGDAEIQAFGRVEIGTVGGAASVKNGNGDTEIGEVAGPLKLNASNGRITVGVAHAGAEAKSANGHIRLGEAPRGRVELRTSTGDIEIGIPEATAAWLDLHTGFGRVENSLGPSEGPGGAQDTVEVQARTSVGDILIRRA